MSNTHAQVRERKGGGFNVKEVVKSGKKRSKSAFTVALLGRTVLQASSLGAESHNSLETIGG